MNPLNQAYQLFIDEVPEHLITIENGLLHLRENKTISTVHAMMRSAHSLKGGSASVGLKGIKDIAHKLEDYLKALYNDDLIIDAELEDLFLAGYDCLALPLKEQLETGNFHRQEAQNRANEVWEKLELKLGNTLTEVKNYLPSSEDLGIDIIASIFEVDVAQEIRRLKGLVASPDSFEPIQELQESLDILVGFSELVNLSGFSLLTNITQQALQKHPDKAVIIAQLLVQDLDKSRDAVLLGDRIEGGSPCSALLTLAQDTSADLEIENIEVLAPNYEVTFSLEDPSYQFFIAEIPDLLHNLESGLLTVKEDKSIAKVNDMMRSAHSIKGGAASVGLESIKNISHTLEDYLKALFDDSVMVDDELENYLLEAFDCLKNALHEQIETGNSAPQWEENASVIWDKLAQKLGHIDTNDYLPSSADLGIDLVESLFDVDILQIIEHLKTSLNQLPIIELQQDVILQLEMLTGFGEMTNLLGLKNIADTVSQAIKNYPHRIQQITSYLINDLTQAREDVLLGDREQGGTPCTILQELAGILDINNSKESTIDFSDLVLDYDDNKTMDTHILDEQSFKTFNGETEAIATHDENALNWSDNIDFADLIDNNDDFDLNDDLTRLNDDEPSQSLDDSDFDNSSLHNAENVLSWNDNIEFGDLIDNDDTSMPLNEAKENNELDFSSLAQDYQENSFMTDDFDDLTDFASLIEDSQEIEDYQENDRENPENIFDFADMASELNNLESFIDIPSQDNLNGNEDEVLTQQQELQAQAYVFYLEEAVDLMALIDNGLESALDTRDMNEVNEVARAAHSLKGGARSAGLEDLGNIALRVEKSLKALFNENIPLDDDTKVYIRQIYQLLRQPLVARLENQSFDEKLALESINKLWAEFEEKYGEEIAKSEEFLPSSSDLGIDIASSIFEVDVVEGIEALKSALDTENQDSLLDLVLMHIEIFSGFGEMLSLPGFLAICQTAQKALENNPNEIFSITKIFIDNLEMAQKLVIEGDRDSGGAPSHVLLTLAGKGVNENATENILTEYTEKPIDTTDQSYSFFVEEAPELLQIIEHGLLTLREDRSTSKIHQIMRAAHSLKGGSASVGLEAINIISHHLEDIFKVFYDPNIELDAVLESWLLEGFDCLKNALTQQIETGSYNPQETLMIANDIWQKINGKLGSALTRVNDYIPSSTDLGVDIVQSMFDIDVEEELKRLKEVVKNPSSQPLAGELRATLEVFSGFGEMLALPGFAEIARLGLMAIEKNSHHALTIIKIIIEDVDNARNLVLQGDRSTGGKPSEELRRFAENNINDDENYLLDEEEDNNIESQSSLFDVFGEVESTTEEVFIITQEDKETQRNNNNPDLENVFDFNISDEQVEAINQAMLDDDDDIIPNIEDIFESEFSQEEIELLAKASELALEEDKSNTIPSISEVFHSQNQSVFDDDTEENSLLEEEDIDLPSLSQVFSSVDMSVLDDREDENSYLEEEDIDLPSLSQVFSSIDMSLFDDDDIEENIDLPSLSKIFSSVDMSVLDDDDMAEDNLSSQEEIDLPSLSQVFSNVDISTMVCIEDETEETITDVSNSSTHFDEVIKSIGNVYQNLPGLKTEEEINSNFNKKVTKITQKEALETKVTSTSTGKTNLTVRVDLERLERMNNLIGELSINRNGLSLQNDKLQTSVKELLQKFMRFQQTANNLRDLSDKMIASPDKFRPLNNNKTNKSSFLPFSVSEDGEFNLNSAFDSLEMDSYDNMYYVIEGLIEQMIQLEESVDDIALYAGQTGQTVENQRQMLNRLRDELMWARMLPLGEVLNRFPRVLRDLSVKYNKKVNLKLNGTSVLVDKAALEKLYDPLVHLIRNGFDHGIEIPEIRKQRGKSETGIIEVKAYHQGNQTIIEIKDDGGGLNLNKIGQKAIERELLTPEQLAVTTKENLLNLIFEPGFSTAASVTEISGRGVGLDIVRSQLRSLKGTISVDSQPGLGTTFIMKLPLTLTIDKLLVLSAENHFYALPSDNIEEIIVPEAHQLKTSGNKRFLHYEQTVVPIYPMIDLLEYRCYIADNPNTSLALEVLPTPEDWGNPLLLMRLGQELFAIEVDHLLSEQELVIKPFGSALTAPSYTYGCTILGDGTLIPVINTATLLTNFFNVTQPNSSSRQGSFGNAQMQKHDNQSVNTFQAASILVVDDSAAMRRTLALSLEKSGYRVIQAKDGKDALEQLQQSSSVSLIICDIEMPNMNGFEFLGQRRRYPELNKIPVAMLTSRSNDKHRKLATHLGANAYFTKPYIEQKFLQSIRVLVEQNSAVMA